MNSYNYDTFSTGDYDFKQAKAPDVGDKAPDFRLTTSAGETVTLLGFDTDFLVLEIGSLTCPLFQSRRKIMSNLDHDFGQVKSIVLYVREAHPGQNIAAHRNFQDKQACALRLAVEEKEIRLVLVDGFDGSAHRAYGSMPNAVFIIDRRGLIVFRSDWNNPSATKKALTALIAGKTVKAKSYFRPPLPWIAIQTLAKAGKGSTADFLKGLPFLFWTNIIKRNLRLLFGK